MAGICTHLGHLGMDGEKTKRGGGRGGREVYWWYKTMTMRARWCILFLYLYFCCALVLYQRAVRYWVLGFSLSDFLSIALGTLHFYGVQLE